MRLYPSRPSLPPPAAPTRAYPSSLTDAEWAVLAPLVQRPASPQGGRPPSTRCARSSTRSATWSAPAAPGGCWPTSSHPRARCMGGLPSGPPTAPWPGCTIPCPSRSASRRVATLFPRRRSSTPSRCGRPTRSPDAAVGGMPARRSTAASGTWRWTPWGCCWWSWSPPPASRTATRAGRCCGACVPASAACGCAGPMAGMPAGWSPGLRRCCAWGPDRAQAPGPVDLRGAAAPVGGGADLGLDRQASPHRARLRAAARPSRRDGHLGHGRGDDPPSRPFPSSTTSRCRRSDTVWVLTRLLLRVQRSAS
jgi:hypothetical protein